TELQRLAEVANGAFIFFLIEVSDAPMDECLDIPLVQLNRLVKVGDCLIGFVFILVSASATVKSVRTRRVYFDCFSKVRDGRFELFAESVGVATADVAP